MIHNFTGCRRNGWNGDKNRRGGPKITKVMIENVGVININPKSRGKSSRNDRECDEENTSSDKRTTSNTPSADDTTTTTAAVNSDVTPAEQPSRRVRRMASKTAKPKKGKENVSSIFCFSLLTLIFVIICSSKVFLWCLMLQEDSRFNRLFSSIQTVS